MTELSDAETNLGQHIVAHALETPDGLREHVDDDVEWDYDNWTIRYVDTDDGWYEVHATQSSSQSERVSRGSLYHPPEYKNHDVTLHLVARVKWTVDNPLGGNVEGEIEQEGGIPSPPDPEPR